MKTPGWLWHGVAGILLVCSLDAAQAQRMPQERWFAVTNLTGFGQPMGMALGTNGIVYVADEALGQVHLIETDGTPVASWSGFNSPRDVAISPEGYVYVADTGNHEIKVFDHAGSEGISWGGLGSGEGEFNTPTTVSVLRSGNLVVADGRNSRIQIFNSTGEFIRQWGEPGSFDGQFATDPFDRALIESEVGADGLIYVSEPGMARIQKFDESGTYIGNYTVRSNANVGAARAYLTRGLDVFFYRVTTNQYFAVNKWYYQGFFAAYGNQGNLLQIIANEVVRKGVGGEIYDPVAGHALELPDGTLFIAHENGTIWVYKRYYRNRAYDWDAANAVPVPVVIRSQQRPGTTWLDIDFIVHDGNDAAVSVAALAYANGGDDLGSVIKLTTLVEGTGGNLGEGVATGVEHRLTWDVAADWSTNYADVQIEILARDGRSWMDFHFVTVPASGENSAVTINRSMISEEDLLSVWMWLISTGDPDIELESGTILGQASPYIGQELASGVTTTASGRAFLFSRLDVVEATEEEKQQAVAARAITGSESTYWVKPKP